MPRQVAIVCTTIFEPKFLDGYLEDIERSGRTADVRLFVIIDKKTPPSVAAACEAARQRGFDVRCPAIDEQTDMVRRWELPEDYIPWNTDNRRNVGFLAALESGCDVLISIDDDNFVDRAFTGDDDFVGGHLSVGESVDGSCRDVVKSSDEWFNICERMDAQSPGEPSVSPHIFARGFPYYAQQPREISFGPPETSLQIGMNAGLWLNDPDVDAVYRLCRRPQITGASSRQVLLGPETWSPVNTQNTGLTREAALTYYYVRMGYPLRGLTIDRFGDILSGYLTQKCVKHCGQAVRLGTPIVNHDRTPHNLFKDLYHELAGVVLIEELLPWLIDVKLTGSTPLEAYDSLADAMASAADQFTGFIWDDGGRDFLRETAAHMKTWSACVRRIAA